MLETLKKMYQKMITKKSAMAALVVVVFSFVVGSMTLQHALIAATPEQEIGMPIMPISAEGTQIGNKATSTIPTRLIIPKISVDAAIADIGVSIHNTIAVPRTYSEVGWYRYGPVPGASGTSIMDGHLDNGFGLDAVFKRLKEIKIGDDVFVENAQGQKLRFQVTETKTLSNTSSTAELFAKSDTSKLVLITCEGQWLPDKQMYSDRLWVVMEFRGIVE